MGLGYFVPDRSFCRSSADTAGRSSIDQNIFTIMKARTRVLSQLTAIVTCFSVNTCFLVSLRVEEQL